MVLVAVPPERLESTRPAEAVGWAGPEKTRHGVKIFDRQHHEPRLLEAVAGRWRRAVRRRRRETASPRRESRRQRAAGLVPTYMLGGTTLSKGLHIYFGLSSAERL